MKFKYTTEIQVVAFGILKPRELTPGVTYIAKRWTDRKGLSREEAPTALVHCYTMYVLLEHDGNYYAWMEWDRPKTALHIKADKPEGFMYHQWLEVLELAKEQV